MGIINKITNGVTDKVGKKVLDIEEINEKDILPKNEEEIAQRREKLKLLLRKIFIIFRDECCANSRIRLWCRYQIDERYY